MTHLLQTERLNLCPCQLDHLADLHSLWVDPEIRRFLFDDRQISLEEARSFILASMDSFTHQGYGIWLFFERCVSHLPASVPSPSALSPSSSPPFAGFAGFLGEPPSPPNLLFGTRPTLWRRGYATEATSAVMQYGFQTLGFTKVIADVDEPNTSSIRVLEALGLSLVRRAVVDQRPLLYYELSPH